MEVPELNAQFYTGFPSLFVPYGATADFFYSGHCGAMTIMMFECWATGHWYVTLIYIPLLVFMMLLMVISHNHYTLGNII